MPCPDDLVANPADLIEAPPTDFKQFTQASRQVADILDDAADAAIVAGLLRTLRTLRTDADRHGELLATLCIPQNREAIRRGDKSSIDQLFELIDTFAEGHKMRLEGALIERMNDE